MHGTRSRLMGGVLASVIGLALTPTWAGAATRYSTPNPAPGADCSSGAPCGLVTAVGGASGGDTVIVGVGTYGSPGAPLPALSDDIGTLAIRGAVIGPGRPVIYGGEGLRLAQPGSTASDLELVGSSPDFDVLRLAGGASATRLIARTTGMVRDACAVQGAGTTLSDSLCRRAGTPYSGVRVEGTGAILRNVTVIADEYGLFHFPGTSTAINSIFRGGRTDVLIYPNASASLTNNEYATTGGPGTITATGTVSAPPTFAGPEDFHTTAGSPGIGAGLDDPANSALDLDGHVRVAGDHIDIGAYEFGSAPPTVPGGGPVDPGTATACPGGTSASVRCGNRADGRLVMIGTGAAERFVGTSGDDIILAGGGDDAIYPSGGDDDVDAGPGADRVAAGKGGDTVDGGDGNDRLIGAAGRDTLNGQAGRDKLTGGSGADKLTGGRGADRLSGGKGNDRHNGGTGHDRIGCGPGAHDRSPARAPIACAIAANA